MKITLDIDDQVMTALSLVTEDPKEWLANAAVARADAVVAQQRQLPGWTEAVAATVRGGGQVTDLAVIAAGIDAGIFKTAQQRGGEARAAFEASMP